MFCHHLGSLVRIVGTSEHGVGLQLALYSEESTLGSYISSRRSFKCFGVLFLDYIILHNNSDLFLLVTSVNHLFKNWTGFARCVVFKQHVTILWVCAVWICSLYSYSQFSFLLSGNATFTFPLLLPNIFSIFQALGSPTLNHIWGYKTHRSTKSTGFLLSVNNK